MALDPRRQQQLAGLQRKQQTGVLNTRQENRLNFLQGQQPQQGANPNAGRAAMDRLIPRNARIKSPSDALMYGQTVQDQQSQNNFNWSNLGNQYGIGGSREIGIDPNTGTPFSRDTLAPEQQALYDQENQVSGSALSAANSSLASGQNFDRAAVEDKVFNNLMRSTNQQKELESKQLSESLAQRGIPVGSELYNSQMQQFNNRYDELTNSARDRAAQFAGEEMSRNANISNTLAGIGPGMRSPNLQGFQAPPPQQLPDPLTSQVLLQNQRLARRQQKAQELALSRVGGGGGRGGGTPDPNADSPFYA